MITRRRTELMILSLISPELTPIETSLAEIADFADIDSEGDTSKLAMHFANVEANVCQNPRYFDVSKDCDGGNCIVTAIPEMAMRLLSLETSHRDRANALKYLVHLMGDIHQPLHIGVDEDKGGNFIRVTVEGNDHELSLHEVWDWVIRSQGTHDSDVIDYTNKLYDAIINTRKYSNIVKSAIAGFDLDTTMDMESLTDFAIKIATETFRDVTCIAPYGNPFSIHNGDVMSPEYMRDSFNVVEEQIIKASARLAYLLDSIADARAKMKKIRAAERLESRIASLVTAAAADSVAKAPNQIPVSRTMFEILAETMSEDDDVSSESEGDEQDEEDPVAETSESSSTSHQSPEERRSMQRDRKAAAKAAKRAAIEAETSHIIDGFDVSKTSIVRVDGFSVPVVSSSDLPMDNIDVKLSEMSLTFPGQVFPIKIGYDTRALPHGFTVPLIRGIYKFLTGDLSDDPSPEDLIKNLTPLIGPIPLISGTADLVSKYMDRRSEWFVVRIRSGFVVLTTRELIREDRKPRTFRFNLFAATDSVKNRTFRLLVDSRFVDDFIPEPVRNEIVDIVSRQPLSCMTRFAETYTKFSAEMGDIFDILNDGILDRTTQVVHYVSVNHARADKPYLKSVGYMSLI